MAEKFEAQYQMERAKAEAPAQQLPPFIQQAKAELEAALNADKARTVPASIQAPLTDDPNASASGGVLWWSGCTLDQYIPLRDYADPARQRDLQTFAVIAPLCMLAEATMIKKAQSLQWTLEGGRNVVNKWHSRLLNLEGNVGWDYFLTRIVRSYLESDNGGVAEVVRAAPGWAVDKDYQLTERGLAAIERGADIAWDIVDLRVFDPVQLQPTASNEYPLVYKNPSTGRLYKLRDYNFVRILDMPSIDHRLVGKGICALSRAAWDVQEDRIIKRYSFEKMSENPGAGMIFVNASEQTMKTAVEQGESDRKGRGAIFYKGLIFIPILNPEGTFSAEFISFSGLPDGFDRAQVYQELKERVATAYGLDPLDLGGLAGAGSLGTGAQATVMASKSKGKGIGVLMQAIEREFRFKVLPESLEFAFEQQETAERQEEAQIHKTLFENAKMYFDITGDPMLAQQYLVDNNAIPPEYIPEDITPDIERDDTEAQDKARRLMGERVKKWQNGKVARMQPVHVHAEKQIERLAPLPGPPLPELDPTISEDDIDKAVASWNVLFPELAGMLEARPSGG